MSSEVAENAGCALAGGCYLALALAAFGLLVPLLLAILLVPVLVWWIYGMLAHWIFIGILLLPTIAVYSRWKASFENGTRASYTSLESKLSSLLGLAPTGNAALSFLLSVMIWALLQFGFAALLLLLFPHHP